MPNDDRSAKGLSLLRQLQERGGRLPEGLAPVDHLDTVLQVSPQDVQELLVFLTRLGYIERSPQSVQGQTLYRITPTGRQELLAGQLRVQDPPPVSFQQTVHGTANTQVGSFNTMNVQVGAGVSTDELLRQLAALRGAVASLPEDEQEEAAATLERAEQAVQGGTLDKLQRYVLTFLDLGTKSVEFGTKAHEFLKALGLV